MSDDNVVDLEERLNKQVRIDISQEMADRFAAYYTMNEAHLRDLADLWSYDGVPMILRALLALEAVGEETHKSEIDAALRYYVWSQIPGGISPLHALLPGLINIAD